LLFQARDLPFRETVVQRGIHLVLRIKCNGTRLRAIRASALRRANIQRDADGFWACEASQG
jgi:hypothetical protein